MILRLHGRGHLTIELGSQDHARFPCDGVPRYLAAGHVLVSAARGCVILEGADLGLDFHGGLVDATFLGDFRSRPDRTTPRLRRAA